jgi:hypothetical protein
MGVAGACDRDLVAAARRRDPNAFEALLQPLIEPGYRLAYSVLQAADPRPGGAPALFAYATGDAGRTWSQPVRVDGPVPAGPSRAVFALDRAHWWASAGSGADLLVTANGGRTTCRHAGVLPSGCAFRSLGFWSSGASWWPLTPPA